MEFLKKTFTYNEWAREVVYLFKPFVDGDINASCTLFQVLMMIPFLRILIFRMKVGRVGKNLKLKYPVYVQNGRNVFIGDNVSFGPGTHLIAGETSSITIGNNVACAPSVFIASRSHGRAKGDPIKFQDCIEKDTVIGNDVWLGVNSVVLENTRLADGTILGANSVAGPNFSNGPDEILFGVPAQLKRVRK